MSILEAHNVRVVGSGDQFVVLGHGFGTDQSLWKHLVPHLVKNYQVVLFDLIGSGTTDPENFHFQRYSTLHGYADDLLAILEELEIETCIYVGHSVSGMVGCLASLERPEAFSKLILVAASPRYLNDSCYFGGFEQEDLNQLFEAIQSNFKAWVTGFAPLAVGADIESPVVQEFARTLFNIRPDIALSVVKTIFQSDVREVLPRVRVPCHVLQSTKDLAVPVVVAHYLERSLGGETYVEIFPTEGHLPQLSSPEIVIPIIVRHISAPTGKYVGS
ncbi:hypothetical protein R1sor_009936 [Riccia sorocarpa]|uniref:AB hydrolase-1 domain-containing protein n=1 Tax=Riccia sorocarpa TaxID=122646 RepID=A0ABD3I039_9MARC